MWWGAEPELHILPHWNWAGKEGQEIEVWAYCNQESVELFFNGQPRFAAGEEERTPGVEGEVRAGHLEARASKGGKVVLTDKRETAGPAVISLLTQTGQSRGQRAGPGGDQRSIVDAQARMVPAADNKVAWAVGGPGSVIGVGNGDPSCHEPDRATERSAFNGLCMAIVQSKRGQAGTIAVTVSSAGLEDRPSR